MALKKIEASSKSAEELAKALFLKIFKDDLEHRPNAICTTSNRLDGREQCDPTKLRGIRCMFVCVRYWDYNNIGFSTIFQRGK